MAKLIYQDPDSGQEVSVNIGPDAPEITIGRNPGNTIRVNNPSISRKHAKMVFDAGQVTLYDLNSSNGSYVNGNRVQNQALEDGDRIRTGEFPLDFVETADADLGMSAQLPPQQSPAFGSGAGGQNAFANDLGEQGRTAASDDDFYDDPVSPDGGEPIGDSYGDDYAEPLMLEDSDFEEVLSEASDAQEPAGTVDGIYPYQDEEPEDEPDFYVDGDDFYEENEEVEPLDVAQPPVSLDSDDTLNAPRDVMLQGMADSTRNELPTADEPAAPPAQGDAPLSSAVQLELDELRTQVERLESEREDLIQEINANAQNPQGGAQRQLDRLRGERNRLSEERRTLIGQLKEARAELDERPEIAEMDQANQAITESKTEISGLESALSSAREDISARDESIEALQTQLKELQDDFEQIQHSYSEVSEEKLAAADHGTQLGNELEQTQEKLSELQSRYELSEATIESLEADLAELSDQRDTLRQDLDARTQTVSEQESEIAGLKEHAQAQDEELDSFGEREESLKSTIASLENDVENLQQTLDARPTEANVAALRDELATALEQLSATTEERDALLDERAQLQKELAEKRALLSDLEDRLDVVSAERDEARRERDGHKLEKQAFARETDYLQTNRRKWVDQIEALEAKVASLEADRKKKKTVFAELSSDLRSLVQKNEGLKTELDEANKLLEAGPSLEKVEQDTARIAELEEELSQIHNEMAELNADSSELTRQLGEVAQHRDELAEELAQAQLEHEEEVEELSEKISQANENGGADLAAIQEQHQLELDAVMAERDELSEQIDALEEKLNAGGTEDADSRLQERVAELEAELSDREATLEELILARDELEDKLQSQAS